MYQPRLFDIDGELPLGLNNPKKEKKNKEVYQPKLFDPDKIPTNLNFKEEKKHQEKNKEKNKKKEGKERGKKEKKFFIMPFGKHKGEKLQMLIFQDPLYVKNLKNWILEQKVEKFYFIVDIIDQEFKKLDKLEIQNKKCELCKQPAKTLFFGLDYEEIEVFCEKCARKYNNLPGRERVGRFLYSKILSFHKKHNAKKFLRKWKERVGIDGKITEAKVKKLLSES